MAKTTGTSLKNLKFFLNLFSDCGLKSDVKRQYVKFAATGEVYLKSKEENIMKTGSVKNQVQQAFKEIRVFDESKHVAKEAFKATAETRQIDKFMSNFAKETGIFSYQTYKDYLQVSVNFAQFIRENFGIKDISKLNSEHAKAFLESKANLSKTTVQKYSSALEKFETALSIKYNKEFSFNVKSALPSAIKENLKVAERSGYHPYSDVKAILTNINENKNISDAHKFVVNIVAETGLRGHKAITAAGIRIDTSGNVFTQSKGGRIKVLNLSQDLKSQFNNYLERTGNNFFKLSERDYKQILSELKIAAKETNQSYEAIHGFRHSYALSVLSNLQGEKNMSFKEATHDKGYIQSLDHNREVSAYRRG